MQEGAKEILKYFYHKGISQSLVSAAKQQMLNKLMEHHKIGKYFVKVSGLSDHYANSKLEVGRTWIKELGMPASQILFIGDTLHDVEVANEIGANCALVAHGHAPYERLSSSGEMVFHNLYEFKEWFEEQ
jgi:phosphoglycolate phosphatase